MKTAYPNYLLLLLQLKENANGYAMKGTKYMKENIALENIMTRLSVRSYRRHYHPVGYPAK